MDKVRGTFRDMIRDLVRAMFKDVVGDMAFSCGLAAFYLSPRFYLVFTQGTT